MNDSFCLKVYLENTTGSYDEYKIAVRPTDTVIDLKNKVQELSGVNSENQLIFHDGRFFQDKETLGTYKLTPTIPITISVNVSLDTDYFGDSSDKTNDANNSGDFCGCSLV